MKMKKNIWWVGKRAYRNLGRNLPWSSRSKNIATAPPNENKSTIK
jgi:hypothetical protein